MKCNKGQTLLEALIVIVFTTIMMFAFLQVCIIVVDDMLANEAAFVAARSAAVTNREDRLNEAKNRAKNYISFFYPLVAFSNNKFNPSNFVFVSKKDFAKNIKIPDIEDEKEMSYEGTSDSNSCVTIWKGQKKTKDYSGKELSKETVKIYYFSRILFGSLVAKENSTNNRRYQSARNRIIPSPDQSYYFKAFPGARKFEK